MIYALVGRPRSGKSYEAVVYHIIPAIKEGRKVITNIPLNMEWFRKVFGSKADLIEIREGKFNEFDAIERPFTNPDDYITDWRNENNLGPLFVIDEAHMVLPRQCKKDILYFYSMHGHHGVDILLLTQNLRKVNADIRDMVEVTYMCIKNTHLGTDKTYTKKQFLGVDTKNPVDVSNREYDKNYFGSYQSHTASNSAVTEATAKDVKSVKNHWSAKFGRIFIIGGLVYLVWVYFYFFTGDDTPESVQPEVETTQVESAQGTQLSSSTASGFGLLEGYEFFVSGWSNQVVMHEKGFIDGDNSFFRVYVDVYAEEAYQFTLNHNDLRTLGYTFDVLTDCVYRMSYFDTARTVTCKERPIEGDSSSDSADDVLAAVPSVSI